jgi:hypothetical protein
VPQLWAGAPEEGQVYAGPVHGNGQPLSIGEFRDAHLVNIGAGKYWMVQGDPTDKENRKWIKDSSGQNYVYEPAQFEDTIRRRNPNFYIDKDKRPDGIMKLGGPGMVSAPSAVEKTLFAGEESRTADHGMAAEAKEMEKAGRSAREIFETTGWLKTDGGKWKSEIDDSKSAVTKMPKVGQFVPLGSFFQHDDLYAAYPELKGAEVSFFNQPREEWLGIFDPATSTMRINLATVKDEDTLHKVILHEVQHKLRADSGQKTGYTLENYRDNPTENEAFDAEARRNMSKGTRRINPPRVILDAEAKKNSEASGFTTQTTDATGRVIAVTGKKKK